MNGKANLKKDTRLLWLKWYNSKENPCQI